MPNIMAFKIHKKIQEGRKKGMKHFSKMMTVLLAIIFVVILTATPCFAAEEVSVVYYNYEGDKISSSLTPVKGTMYFPVVKDETVQFYLNMDGKSDLFTGDTEFIYACKLSVLSFKGLDRAKLLMSLIKPVKEEQITKAVGEETFSFAKTTAKDYGKATTPVVTTYNFPAFVSQWLGY